MPDPLAIDHVEGQFGDELSSAQNSKRRHKLNRACVACRNTKTKCLPSKIADTCEACLKKSRPCVPCGPVKPRMKSSEKFSELEKKIESLTKALSARDHQDQPQTPPESGRSIISSEDLIQDKTINAGGRFLTQLPERLSNSISPALSSHVIDANRSYVDVIDQGFIDCPTAEVLFNHYCISMHPILPILDLSGETNLERVRATKPVSLMAILAISSASILPSFEPRLLMELNEQLARHVFILGTQSLDLVQALLIYSQYYIRPSSARSFTQTHFVSSAVTMSYDLMLNNTRRDASRRSSRAEKERSRTWLACWFAASINSMVLHQPCIVSTSNEIENSLLNALHDSPESSHSDQWLFTLFRMQRLVEEAATIYGPMTSKPLGELEENSIALKLKMCQQRLEKWKAAGTPAMDPQLVIHHVAMRNIVKKAYAFYNANRFRADASAHNPALPPWQVEAIFRCLVSSQALLDIYCGLEDSLARSLPNMFLVWTIFAGFSLVKLSYLAEVVSSADSTIMTDVLSQKTTPDFLDAMVSKIEAISRNGYLPQAKGFGLGFKKLRLYYVQKQHMCLHPGGDCEASIDGEGAQIISPMGDSSRQNKANPSIGAEVGSDWPSIRFGQISDDQPSSHQALPDCSTQATAESFQDFSNAAEFPIPAVYDPSTYDNMNWDNFMLDDVAMKEMDDFIMQDDSGWMRTFF
ncbi:uncharacterized protein A1O9_07044 [Exophiala aquamarina CBS 119918]|uniref:Zn(2)-C6 fungal-type domain-containing protein n=1 Tax=Exophiala aquamarina CBS 119918 TaxID=1182545 RepID=A0A072P9S3_9EURO|nr:uncharacterized protein A1O9_07044 [Exophiala aquamarina CBS 119918]KEF56854.1 hypothetical protein A1O9_07044 [Exophiala aquamarina CBS 119918]